MSQTKFGSFVEAHANLAIGWTINFCANMAILPVFGFTTLTWQKNLALGTLYSGISLVRQYVIRRWFNKLKFGNVEKSK